MRGGGTLNTFFSLMGGAVFSLRILSSIPPTSVCKCWSLFDLFGVSMMERMTGGLGLHPSVSFEWSLK